MPSFMRVRGTRRVQKNMGRLITQVPGAFSVALYQEAEKVMSASKRQTPVDTGRLRASGFVELPDVSRTRVRVQMGFGTNYAVYVHERTDLRHPTGNAKFLSRPLDAAAQGLAQRLGARTRNALERGQTIPRRGVHPVSPPTAIEAVT